uniref:AAA+ ATPase domain-containing protein n=1 Tax=viral metagenome TaxID=1070528 RepID=A0A6C0B998_9ZZZZ
MKYLLYLSFFASTCCFTFPNKKLFLSTRLDLFSKTEGTTLGTLMKDIENKNVETVYFSDDLRKIYFEETNPESGIPQKLVFSNPSISGKIIGMADNQNIDTTILEKQIDPVINTLQTIGSLASSLFWTTLIFGIIQSIIRGQRGRGGGPMPGSNLFFGMPGSQGQGQDKINMIKANISLSSWAGSPEIFEECTEIVSYLKDDTVYKAAGADVPRGILLEGPPGTGKTLIAKAIASESDANFISVSASEFIEVFVGVGASKVRNLFKTARENKPSIIFIDEIDSIGRQRGAGVNLGNDEREQTLNQLLAEMDGFAQNDQVLVIAATNRKDVLDAALLRPGRFDRLINVPLPDKPSRISILNVHMRNKQFSNEINIPFLAELTAGFSGAQLKNLINEGAINAARQGNSVISQKDLEGALEKLLVGIVKRVDTRSDATLERVSYHEIGHAFLAEHFNQYFDLKKVTIQSTYNGAGGYTLFNEYPEIVEGGLYTKDLLKKRLIVAMGGKAAEYIFYGDEHISLGAIQDLKQANGIAQQMIGNYGMGKDLEVFYNENIESNRNPFLGRSMGMGDKYSEKTKEKIDEESLDLVNEAYREALAILRANEEMIQILKNILLKDITISGSKFKTYVKLYENKNLYSLSN